MDSSDRRTSRASWQFTIQREPNFDLEDAEDVAFWLRIPVEERARATWQLSKDLFALAEMNGGAFDADTGLRIELGAPHERRLPRTSFRVTRR